MPETHTQTYAALSKKDFDSGCGFIFRDIWLCEDENGMYVYAFGHLDAATYALAVNEFDAENGADAEDGCEAKDVQHHWSVTTQPADGPDGWWIRWDTIDGEPITAETPNAFPPTVVSR